MSSDSLTFVFINAALINNFVLSAFLGICPFIGVSKKLETATRMGMAVTFVMLVSSLCAFGVHKALVAIDAQYLQIISYIVIIASAVQLVEMFIRKFSPALFRALGIFLPLITTNCAILGLALFQTSKEYDFFQSLVYALGAGAGFMLAIVIMAAFGRAERRQRYRYRANARRVAVAQLYGFRRAGRITCITSRSPYLRSAYYLPCGYCFRDGCAGTRQVCEPTLMCCAVASEAAGHASDSKNATCPT